MAALETKANSTSKGRYYQKLKVRSLRYVVLLRQPHIKMAAMMMRAARTTANSKACSIL